MHIIEKREYKVKGEAFKAEVDCSAMISDYKSKTTLVEREMRYAMEDFASSGSFSTKHKHEILSLEMQEIYFSSHAYMQALNPAIFEAGMRMKSKLFDSQDEARPMAQDMLVFDNISLIVPSQENLEVSRLYDEIASNQSSLLKPAAPCFAKLEYFTYSVSHKMETCHAWGNNICDIRSVAYAQEALMERKGMCKEKALTLYLMLKKAGFKDVSLVSIAGKTNPLVGHMVVKARIGDQAYLADPMWDLCGKWDETFNEKFSERYYQVPQHVMHNPISPLARK